MDAPPRIVITGINGLIGGILRPALAAGYAVSGIDANPPFSEAVIQADISEYDQVLTAFQKLSPARHLVHLAATSDPKASWDDVLRHNVVGTRNVFEAARQIGVTRLVYASSNHVTGAYEGFDDHLHLHLENEPEKIRVNDPIRPDSEYGVSKAFGEALARYYSARWGIQIVCLRIGSVRKPDRPSLDPRLRKTWLSHRDLIHLVERSLLANVAFGIYYGVSDNTGALWDVSNARSDLGYTPEDNAART